MTAPFLTALLEGRRREAAALLGAALPDGWPDEHDERFLRLRLGQLERDPERAEWPVFGIVVEERLAGHAGYHGPPGVNGLRRADAVEVGYTVFRPFRGRGLAQAAVRELVARARAGGAASVVASVAPDNAPSLAIVRKLGFAPAGEQWDDEDGLELVFVRECA